MALFKQIKKETTGRSVSVSLTADQAQRLDRIKEAAREKGLAFAVHEQLNTALETILTAAERELGIAAPGRRPKATRPATADKADTDTARAAE